MAGKQLCLALSNIRELVLQGLSDTRMKSAARLPQKRTVGGVLHQRVFEQIRCVRRQALAKQQARRDKSVERRSELHLGLACRRRHKSVGNLAADSRANLRYLLGGTEAVQPRQQRGM